MRQPAVHAAERFFPVPIDESGKEITIKIHNPDLVAEGLGYETWASSAVLSSLLHRLNINFPSNLTISTNSIVPVIELGAGTGLVGISAAAILGVPVVLTDLEPIIPGITANASLNSELLRKTHGADVRCGVLDWNEPTCLQIAEEASSSSSFPASKEQGKDQQQRFTTIPSSSKAHVLLAADTVYSSEHPEMLSRVILEWLSPDPEARAVLTYAMRVAYLDEIRELWQRLEDGGLEAVDEGRDRASDEVFDDECLCEWSIWRWKQVV